jgi:hypothetical protein
VTIMTLSLRALKSDSESSIFDIALVVDWELGC